MTARPRPSISSTRRPSSAIFIGAGLPENVPDLPEPPSPGASSTDSRSGLPSPPATNSTGSGSNGDVGSVRHRSASFTQGDMSNGKAYNGRTSSVMESDEEDDGEDHTARFGVDRRRSLGGINDNAAALQRIKNLNQRSRAVMDKLTSRSRVNSPAPSATSSRASSVARHSLPPLSSSSSSASSSSHHSVHASRSHDTALSGSETERDEHNGSNHFHPPSDDEFDATPPAIESPLSDAVRQRRISAPSPGKHVLKLSRSTSGRTSSPGPSLTPRKRASVALPLVDNADDYLQREAVASTSSRRSRQPLPREFLASSNSDELVSVAFDPIFRFDPRVLQVHEEGVLVARGSPSPRVAAASLSPTSTPHHARPPRATNLAARSSTVRELARKHQTRWFSEDLSSSASVDADADEIAHSGGAARSGRRQILRGGSAESPLAAFAVGERSLVGEGLRAAGIGARRRDTGDDVFVGDIGALGRKKLTAANLGSIRRTTESVNGKGKGRLADRESDLPHALVMSTTLNSPRTPANRLSVHAGQQSRPSSSMTGYDDAGNPPRTAPPALRTYKSAYALPERARERPLDSSLARSRTVLETRERTSPPSISLRPESAAGTVLERRQIETPLRSGTLSRASAMAITQSTEHTRLLFHALSMFEDRLTHIPSVGSTGTTTIPEVFRSAKAMAQETEKLNILLRDSTNKAMNEHIQASVDDNVEGGAELADIWQQIGGEFRESLRVSDELVRMMTEFLLGVGKALRDLTGSGEGSPAQHLRTVSLDDDAVRRLTPERSIGVNGTRQGTDDSRSTGSRRSWEPAPRASSRLETTTMRPSPSTSSSQPRTRKISFEDVLRSSTRAPTTTNPPQPAAQRLFSPLEHRDRALRNASAGPLVASDSLETIRAAEPSPTPNSRHPPSHTRLSSLAIPPSRPTPLPTVHSESRLERAAERTHRSKPSTTSTATIRAGGLRFPVLKTSGATTAVTPHSVHQSPVMTSSPLNRSQSSSSSMRDSPVVAFSRPTTTALSELQERQRTISGTSLDDDSPVDSANAQHADRSARHRTVGYQSQKSPPDSAEGAESAALSRTVSQRRERRRTVTEIFSRS
ncbi:hypothetical protein PUNSTDRAFT_131174 [Punctularia strigosozonata HHB-11173 SS5]|uniref:uncharacterized protein n=1 Tax=Punctularia strigosozonata (strain HHB-11173) TaxID=741275 RepID=UPI000441694E|nr:uncharacterized protein PUNSTDRAFT_131174 [Punctularia strigosozonata HHB-11173 SS5]EIN12941.1 hypothetical protein PUNSTDRAFT_131174 [Punctularia strigosozonata HHB-11173 SS5]